MQCLFASFHSLKGYCPTYLRQFYPITLTTFLFLFAWRIFKRAMYSSFKNKAGDVLFYCVASLLVKLIPCLSPPSLLITVLFSLFGGLYLYITKVMYR